MIVLDTNVLSELMRPTPDVQVERWAARVEDPCFTTVISQAEILLGLATMPDGRKRDLLTKNVAAMFADDFRDRIIAFDSAAARSFALIGATRRRAGRPIGTFDAQIAAIALSRGATVATRNVADFRDCGVPVINPWDD